MSEHDADVTVRDNSELNRYEALVDPDGEQTVAGFATYEVDDGRITFLHTEVDDAYGGHGIGGAIVQQSLDDVRAKGFTVHPVCPFYKKFIKGHPEYEDLLAG